MGSTAAPLPMARLVGVGAVVFLANAAMLVLQLVAGRLLAPFIGSSLETWTTVIGVFLTGIALGNGLGGKLADRYPTPKTLAVLLAVGAGTALWMVLFPMLLSTSGVHKSITLTIRIPLLTAILCLPAGLVLSLLTPLAIKLGLPDVGHTGRVAGMVFALSTLGCLLGNYVTGFYLVPAFSINALVFVSAGALAVLAVGTLVLIRDSVSPVGTPPDEAAAAEPPSTNPFAFDAIERAYLIVFLASFCGMTLELTASRIIAQFLGVSLFTWTGVIGVMLAGTALGNFTGGLLADHSNRPGSTLNPRHLLAGTLMVAGAASVFVLVALALVTRSAVFLEWSIIGQVLGWTFALFFLPMYLLGMISPQVIRLAVPDVAHVGQVAGRVYAWSTAGAIVGTFMAGYVLLSTFGMYRTVLGVSLLVTLTSALVAQFWKDLKAQADPGTAPAPSSGPSNVLLYIFSIVLGGVVGGFVLTGRGTREEGLVEQVESNYYTIKVSERFLQRRGEHEPRRFLSLTLDHLIHSTVDPDDPLFLGYEHEEVQIEFLRAARAHTATPHVLVIGGGGYTFPRAAKELMPETDLDVVEIDPKVTQVAYRTLGLKKEYGLHDINMDGRQFVAERAAAQTYDLVIQDAVNDLSVPAHLLTKEYNDEVKKTLKPDGVYLLTIIDSIQDGKLWRAAMRTLKETFSHVTLLYHEPMPDDPEKWAPDRRVYVIYAADRPFDLKGMQDAVTKQREDWIRAGAAVGEGTKPTVLPGGGWAGIPAATAADFPATVVSLPLRTTEIPAEKLAPFLAEDPGVLLTDQYAPVDNLMAEVFRHRNRNR